MENSCTDTLRGGEPGSGRSLARKGGTFHVEESGGEVGAVGVGGSAEEERRRHKGRRRRRFLRRADRQLHPVVVLRVFQEAESPEWPRRCPSGRGQRTATATGIPWPSSRREPAPPGPRPESPPRPLCAPRSGRLEDAEQEKRTFVAALQCEGLRDDARPEMVHSLKSHGEGLFRQEGRPFVALQDLLLPVRQRLLSRSSVVEDVFLRRLREEEDRTVMLPFCRVGGSHKTRSASPSALRDTFDGGEPGPRIFTRTEAEATPSVLCARHRRSSERVL